MGQSTASLSAICLVTGLSLGVYLGNTGRSTTSERSDPVNTLNQPVVTHELRYDEALRISEIDHEVRWQLFLDAIAQVETGGERDPDNTPPGDAGEIGRFQIIEAYWTDAGLPGTHAMCADPDYAETVMRQYMLRYEPTAYAMVDIEVLAALHHGGPNWRNRPHTQDYVRRVVAAFNGQ